MGERVDLDIHSYLGTFLGLGHCCPRPLEYDVADLVVRAADDATCVQQEDDQEKGVRERSKRTE